MTQNTLFGNETPNPAPPARPGLTTDTTGLRIVAAKVKLSPQQQRFNRQLERIDKLQEEIAQMQSLADEFRTRFAQTLPPLQAQFGDLRRAMVLWLHARLQRKGLTVPQQRVAKQVLVGLSEEFALQGDTQMQELHDLHSELSAQDKQKYDLEGAQAIFEDELGLDAQGLNAESAQQMFEKAMQQMAQQIAQEQEKREAARLAHEAQYPASATRQKALQQDTDAHAVLRRLYRQLASFLHPDRETDDALRIKKTALMSQANAAYERRDLVSLLKLQFDAQAVGGKGAAHWLDEKVDALNTLLKRQISQLEQDHGHAAMQVAGEFGLDYSRLVNRKVLERHLAVRKNYLAEDIAFMQLDLERLKDDAYLKKWLKQQKQIHTQQEIEDAMGLYGPLF